MKPFLLLSFVAGLFFGCSEADNILPAVKEGQLTSYVNPFIGTGGHGHTYFEGISGNEDCGQMSAWYIFSSLGFYPVTTGSNQYIIGTPLFEKATINLDSEKLFTVIAERISKQNKYIKSEQHACTEHSRSMTIKNNT